MSRKKVWHIEYMFGASGQILSDASNPHTKQAALAGAAVVAGNGWHVWVKRITDGRLCYEANKPEAMQAAEFKQLRADAHLTLAQAGAMLDVTPQSAYYYESGKVPISLAACVKFRALCHPLIEAAKGKPKPIKGRAGGLVGGPASAAKRSPEQRSAIAKLASSKVQKRGRPKKVI